MSQKRDVCNRILNEIEDSKPSRGNAGWNLDHLDVETIERVLCVIQNLVVTVMITDKRRSAYTPVYADDWEFAFDVPGGCCNIHGDHPWKRNEAKENKENE